MALVATGSPQPSPSKTVKTKEPCSPPERVTPNAKEADLNKASSALTSSSTHLQSLVPNIYCNWPEHFTRVPPYTPEAQILQWGGTVHRRGYLKEHCSLLIASSVVFFLDSWVN